MKKIQRLLIPLILATGLMLTLAWLSTPPSIPAAQAAPAGKIIRVDAAATGLNNGSSWAHAYTSLQDALDDAAYGDEIWVAKGVYTPTAGITCTATFSLLNGVALYGGFAATETVRTQRDWNAHVTVLSGDLDGNDATDSNSVVTDSVNIVGNNAYHVVTIINVSETAVLDGFTVTGGNANGISPHNNGGGMYTQHSTTTLTNVIFSGNTAFDDGGGMYNWHSTMTLANVVFSRNAATNGRGGGMRNVDSTPTLTNAIFSTNFADWEGGGIDNYHSDTTLTNVIFDGNITDWEGGGTYNYHSGVTLTNVTLSGNVASNYGGGMYNWQSTLTLANVTLSSNIALNHSGGIYNDESTSNVHNSILWDNTAPQTYNYSSTTAFAYSLVQGGCPTGATCFHLFTSDPQFVRNPDSGAGDWTTLGDNDYGDLRLGFASPAIDAGDNTAVPPGITTDLDGNPRFVEVPYKSDAGNGTAPIVDLGAYEMPVPDYSQVHLPLVLRNARSN